MLAVQAVERAPGLPEWIEPSVLARQDWPGWRDALGRAHADPSDSRSEEHTSELQSLMRTQYAVFCLKKKKQKHVLHHTPHHTVHYHTLYYMNQHLSQR